MNKRIRINGKLYEAVRSRNLSESYHDDVADAFYNFARKYRRYGWSAEDEDGYASLFSENNLAAVVNGKKLPLTIEIIQEEDNNLEVNITSANSPSDPYPGLPDSYYKNLDVDSMHYSGNGMFVVETDIDEDWLEELQDAILDAKPINESVRRYRRR